MDDGNKNRLNVSREKMLFKLYSIGSWRCLFWKNSIEESFKIIKSEFKTRPVFVSTEEHIEAHFLICFVTLLVMRVLEQLIGKCHSVRQIRNSLASYSCSYLDQNYYLFDYRDDVILTMENTFGLDLSKKIMPLSEIKRITKYKETKI